MIANTNGKEICFSVFRQFFLEKILNILVKLEQDPIPKTVWINKLSKQHQQTLLHKFPSLTKVECLKKSILDNKQIWINSFARIQRDKYGKLLAIFKVNHQILFHFQLFKLGDIDERNGLPKLINIKRNELVETFECICEIHPYTNFIVLVAEYD